MVKGSSGVRTISIKLEILVLIISIPIKTFCLTKMDHEWNHISTIFSSGCNNCWSVTIYQTSIAVMLLVAPPSQEVDAVIKFSV